MGFKDVVLNGNSLPIREFKLDWFVSNPAICMIAKKGSGKSWVCRSILSHYSHFPGGVIISPTDRMSAFYGKFFPEVYIHYKYQSNLIRNILFRQELIIGKLKQKYKKREKVDPRAFLVMDDCLASRGAWVRDEPILELLFNGRHYQIMYILTMQYPLGITPELRANFDYVFLLAEDFTSNQKRIHDHYAGMFPNFDSFKQVFTELTKDYGCMVIVNRGAKHDFINKIFWYRAKKEVITQMGCNQFNTFHKKNYNRKWREKKRKHDISYFVKKKNKCNIKVARI